MAATKPRMIQDAPAAPEAGVPLTVETWAIERLVAETGYLAGLIDGDGSFGIYMSDAKHQVYGGRVYYRWGPDALRKLFAYLDEYLLVIKGPQLVVFREAAEFYWANSISRRQGFRQDEGVRRKMLEYAQQVE